MRVFLCSAAIAIAALSLGCGPQALSSGVDIDGGFRTLIWPEATVLVGANIQALKTTGLYQRHSQELDLPMLNEASKNLGFDPRRDVKQLLFEADARRSVLLARGDLNVNEIQQKLGGMGAKATTYRSAQLFGDERNVLALLNKATAIGGSAESVRSTLDLNAAKRGAIPGDLLTRLNSIPKGSQIWIVSSKGLPFTGLPMRSDVQSGLSNIVAFVSGVTAGLQVGSGVNLDAKITCTSLEGAKRVHDALRGGIGLARLSTKDDQTDLLRIYDAIQVEQKDVEVRVTAALKEGEVDKLMTYLPQSLPQSRILPNWKNRMEVK